VIYKWRRLRLYLDYDIRQYRSSHARTTGRANWRRKQAAIKFMHESLASRPELLEYTTPSFPFEARRTVITDSYYTALLDPKVTLVPHGIKELTAAGTVDANGDEHGLDMIVLATGFDAANYLGNYKVYGEGGIELHDTWKGDPEAFLGLMVPGYPNFFMMYGPNTNSIPLVNFYEAQAAFAADLISMLGTKGRTRARVRTSAMPSTTNGYSHAFSGPCGRPRTATSRPGPAASSPNGPPAPPPTCWPPSSSEGPPSGSPDNMPQLRRHFLFPGFRFPADRRTACADRSFGKLRRATPA
jgi:hypothetical protein